MNRPQSAVAAPVPVQIVHATQTRLRLHAADLTDHPQQMAELADALTSLPGLTRVVGRPETGTLILHVDHDVTGFARNLFASGAVALVPRPASPTPVSRLAEAGLSQLDQAVRNRTSGALDARSALAVMLFGFAVYQAFRGQLAGPVTTLLLGVLSLLGESAQRE